jgi:ABC-type transport system involved in multi-copper enzyme maturation permease subunit
MTYVVWRLHRNQVYVAGGALVALAVVLLIGKGQLGKDAVTVLVYATIVVPVLFGLFWGAPLLAKEFEDGTHSLVWTQGVTRRRWLRSNVTGVLLIAVVWSAALTALITWWSLPEISLQLARSSPGPSIFKGSRPSPTRCSQWPSVLPPAR